MLHEIMGADRALPWLALAFACGYLSGSVPFGILLARVFRLGDLRKIGSGNIGATNVLRTGNKAAAALTLLLDAAKGALPVAVFLSQWGDLAAQVAAVGAFIGHCYPVWLRFRGGKGVATFVGVTLALAPLPGALVCATWLAAVYWSRISSVGALAAAAFAPLWFRLSGHPEAVLTVAVLGVALWLHHWANIRRLVAGTEPKVGRKSADRRG